MGVQNLNNEYRNRVICRSSYNNEIYMLWRSDGSHNDLFIRHLTVSPGIYTINMYINRFDKLVMKLLPRPKRYHYSSGSLLPIAYYGEKY